MIRQVRIFVSESVHVAFGLYQRIDKFGEAALGKAKVGTTGKGIGLCYSFKMDRSGVPVSEVAFDKQTVDLKLRNLARKMQSRYKDLSGFDVEEEILQLDRFGGRLQPLVVNSALLISKAQADQEKLLIECTNALMLDVSSTHPKLNII